MTIGNPEDRVAAVRRFNRFFTRQIGVLHEGLLHTPYSLTEARILFELAQRDYLTAAQLCRELSLDAGYLSRMLSAFERQELVEKVRSEKDARQYLLRLTPQGLNAFTLLDQRSQEEVAEMLAGLSEEDQINLLQAMQTIETIFGDRQRFSYSQAFILRPPKPGDLGWVTHRHGVLYAQEYDWDERFEALVAQIVADFVNHFNPTRERAWIAEMNGEIVGSVFVVQSNEKVAKLRLLLVEPRARGMGLGTQLVEECIRFAQHCGYEKMILWTNSVLVEARKIYQKAGFQIVAQEQHNSYGHALVGETWELVL